MASHLSDIGFSVSEENYYEDLIRIFEDNMSKTAREIRAEDKRYLVVYVSNDIEFWLPVAENNSINPEGYELHYNTHRWETVTNPEWVRKTEDDMQGIATVWAEDFPINITIPNATLSPKFTEDTNYKSQIACFAETLDIYKSKEDFQKEHEGFCEMSFIPTGSFSPSLDEDFEQSSHGWINGVVEKVDHKKNTYTGVGYYHVLVKCFDMKFDILIDESEVQECIANGDIISATVWMSGKIRPIYEGKELGKTERKQKGHRSLNTIDDLYNVLTHCWSSETAYPSCQKDWNENDRSYGQCAITAMLVNDMFGADIYRIKLEDGGTHYFNKIDHQVIDLTREQFDLYDIPIDYSNAEKMSREYCGKNENTKKRYELLKSRIVEHLKAI